MHKERLITLLLIIFSAAASRLLPHPPNVAPIAAMALFAGATFKHSWSAFVVPALALLLSDWVIGFYDHMWVTYLAFSIVVCIGGRLREKKGWLPVAIASCIGSISFFLITNCPLLIHGGLYPATPEGVIQSYSAALPFFRNSLLGDLFYTLLLFGGLALAQKRLFNRVLPTSSIQPTAR